MKVPMQIVLLIFIVQSCFTQDVSFVMSGHRQLYENGDTFLLAEVHLYSNQEFKLGSGQFYINYNPQAFGQNVFLNNKIELFTPDGTIIDFSINAPPFNFSFYNNIIVNDNTSSRASVSWQHAFSQGCLPENNVSKYADLIFATKIKYLPGKANLPHQVCLESGNNFIHQIFTACGPDLCNINNCVNFPGTQLIADNYTCSDCKFVYSPNDSGVGSLREAIECANNGDTIRFAYSLLSDSIKLTTQPLFITKDIYILVKNQFNILVEGSDVLRVFGISTGNNVEISGLKLIEGNGIEGTGILNEGNLILKDITVYKKLNSISDSQILNNSTLHVDGEVKIKE